MIKPLEVLCVDFLLEQLDREKEGNSAMFFTIFQFCIDCSVDKRLMEKCTTIIRSDWGYLIWAKEGGIRESFLKISQKCLIHFLCCDFLCDRKEEMNLFDAVCFYVFVL